MSDIVPFLKSLLSAPGLSGHEMPVRQLIADAWRPLSDELTVSKLGSLHALRRGTDTEPRRSILLAAHMDAIGLIATRQEGEFLHIFRIGGVDPRVLPGQPVTVHGRQDLPGVVVQPPPRLLPSKYNEDPVPLEYLLVDTGLTAEELSHLVRPGDLISFATQPMDMNGGALAGHSLDNRASVAVLTVCLELLQGMRQHWDVWAVATAQEEETLGGAFTSAFQIRPSIAVAVDVTFGTSPGSPSYKTSPLGEGPTLGWGPNIHPALYEAFKDLAERLEIPYHTEVMPSNSGTDAIAMQITAEGIPSMVTSIPLRYMHTPVEMVAVKDIQRLGRLLAEFISGLNENTMDSLTWEE